MGSEARPLTATRLRAAMNAAIASGKASAIPVPGHPGLRLRVRKGGTATWSWQGRIRGRRAADGAPVPPVVITIGNYPDIGIEEACEKALSARKQASEGKRPSLLLPTSKTWRHALKIHNGKVGARTGEEYLRVLSLHASKLADRELADITTEELLSAYERVRSKSPSQAKKLLDIFNAAQKVARALSADDDPRLYIDHVAKVAALTRIEIPQPRKGRALTGEQIPKWWGLLQAQDHTVTRDLVQLAFLTGLRRSELLELRWSEVDTTNGWLDLGDRVKSGKLFARPVGKAATRLLKTRRLANPAHCPWVFPSTKSKSGHVTDLRRVLNRIDNQMGRDVTLHDLRKTYNSRGRDVERKEDMEFLLGHAHHDVNTRHYTDRERPIIEGVAQRVEDRLLELANAKASPSAVGVRSD